MIVKEYLSCQLHIKFYSVLYNISFWVLAALFVISIKCLADTTIAIFMMNVTDRRNRNDVYRSQKG